MLTPLYGQLGPLTLYRNSGPDPDAVRYTAAVVAHGGTISMAAAAAVSALFRDLKADGLWSRIVQICPLVGDQLAAAAAAYRPGASSAVVMAEHNFVNGDYSQATGLQGDGISKYLDTTVDIPSLSATDVFFGLWLLSDSTGGNVNVSLGSSYDVSGASSQFYVITSGGEGGYLGFGNFLGGSNIAPGTGWRGFAYDGTNVTSYNGASVQNNPIPINAGAWQQPGTVYMLNGAYNRFSNARIGFGVVAQSLTPDQNTALVARITTFLAAIGRS